MKTLKTIGFWILSCTWGIIMTLIGAITALVLLITKHQPKRFGPCIYFEVGKGWGGVELGPFFIISKDAGLNTVRHEAGHGIQNIIFGPLMPFLVCIPSALRYWVRNWKVADHRVYFLVAVSLVSILLVVLPLVIIANIYLILWPMFISIGWIIYVSSLFIWQVLEIKSYCKNKGDKPYDSIWFEGWATKLGSKYVG